MKEKPLIDRLRTASDQLDESFYGDPDDALLMEEAADALGKLFAINANHLETLRGIASMDDPERMKLWATDALSGYTETVESTLLKVSDERNRMRSALEQIAAKKHEVGPRPEYIVEGRYQCGEIARAALSHRSPQSPEESGK